MEWFPFSCLPFMIVGVLFPGLPGAASPPPLPATLRVMTYNIHHGEGTDGRFDLERLARIIRGAEPDLVALQEVDRETGRSSRIDQAARLADLTGMRFRFGAAMSHDGGHYGNAVLTRFDVAGTAVRQLPFQPGAGAEPRAVIEVRIEPGGGLPKLVFASVHLCHVNAANREAQTEDLDRRLARLDPPVILAGDLNSRSGEKAVERLLSGAWHDATRGVSRIDYVLVRRQDPWRVAGARQLDEPEASDHSPLVVDLVWEGE